MYYTVCTCTVTSVLLLIFIRNNIIQCSTVQHNKRSPLSFLTTAGTPTNSNSGGSPLSVRVRVVLY